MKKSDEKLAVLLIVGGLALIAARDAKRREEEAWREEQVKEFYRIQRESRKIPVEPPGLLGRIVAVLAGLAKWITDAVKRVFRKLWVASKRS